jgi:alkylation response protein AidB-like acyl-CoA dehydrogenase
VNAFVATGGTFRGVVQFTPVNAKTHLRDLIPQIADRENSAPEDYPRTSVEALYHAGVIAAPFPSGLGGSQWGLTDAVAAIQAIAEASPSTALIASMPLGLAGVLGLGPDIAPAAYRSQWTDQIERIAADYARGLVYAACNSEKGAGGSLEATQTTVAPDPAGGFRITGEKILASSGRNASTFFSTAKVTQQDLPGAGIVEFFLVQVDAPGVNVLADWDGFGMRSTESQTVRYERAPVRELLGFPNFLNLVQPLQYWYCLFAAIPLGCARAILAALSTPPPKSPALRLRLADAAMRCEAMQAYLNETAAGFRAAAGAEYAARVLRTKTYVTQEATKLCAELFALSGGRSYRRNHRLARTLADSFAGTALRPPLALALDVLVENFSL